MPNATLELSDAIAVGSSTKLIRPTTQSVPAPSQPDVAGRPAAALIAQHPDLAANLAAALNPFPPPLARDVALFQSALHDVRRAALDGILTEREAGTLVAAVIEGFAARQATAAAVSAVQSALSTTSL